MQRQEETCKSNCPRKIAARETAESSRIHRTEPETLPKTGWMRASKPWRTWALKKEQTASPCTSWHARREIRTVVHRDDFATLGYDEQLDWFKGEMEKRLEWNIEGELGQQKKTRKKYGSRIE